RSDPSLGSTLYSPYMSVGSAITMPCCRTSDLLPCFRTNLSMISSKERGRGMSRSNHTEAQMIGALKQLEAGRKAEDVAREVGVSKHTIYAWKAKYGGM